MSLSAALAIVGGFLVVFHLTRLVWRCWCGLRQFVLSQFWQVDFRKFGQWAVVTGATSGIGKAYAIELARRGLDVVLVSRSDKKLQLVAKEIEDLYGRKTRTIRADFTDGHRIYPAIAEELQGLQIGVLVNNVGMSISDSFTYFLETPDAEQKITHIVNCNVLSVPQMTRLILPDMVQRGTGLIINISSQVAVRPQPLLSVYSASKIFVTYFSQCLHAEYKSEGIIVQCVTPFMVSTNMTKNIAVSSFVKSAPSFARDALNTVGHSSYTSGCLSHALQDAALTLVPDWVLMSSVFIRKLRNLPKLNDGRACREKEE
ncbi:Very-long-chain 3-oxoacyl-CoA reductase [Larimichthys crocea]|uniref:Very-long-chain 3-oxoacyl-CoA reductase n=1 Tax=Larimichthys crocea TaxID=215358 RepID=A0A6G0I9H2_LARCR|nr:very-long-chain 3-oxoacyl-CoA reductase isoform X1 [Larimichthys crocea]KAE8288178.1 Very-long-chain 3-oxoacyl-CoA reductase [Larimichthys crocea]